MVRLNFFGQGIDSGFAAIFPSEPTQIHQPRVVDLLFLFDPVIDPVCLRKVLIRHKKIEFLLVQISLYCILPGGIADLEKLRKDRDLHRFPVSFEKFRFQPALEGRHTGRIRLNALLQVLYPSCQFLDPARDLSRPKLELERMSCQFLS